MSGLSPEELWDLESFLSLLLVNMPKRILVTASRDWDDEDALREALYEAEMVADLAPWPLVLIHGACPTGGDKQADDWVKTRTRPWLVEREPAQWNQYGRAAGPIRNVLMVSRGADMCLAFIKGESTGATGCASMAELALIPTWKLVRP
jgi:YspA, cpYpsA-related SLOG family